ncbi:MAG TPA: WhiB family transcriptional regulator [Jiangellaceae bacterium]|nr:WhiB family transcriptional regulator [Jiangellaceae bacterium]
MSRAWMVRAACRDGSLAAELTSDCRMVALAAAKRVCPGCPVSVQCRAYGEAESVGNHAVGVYGGTYLRVDGWRTPRKSRRKASLVEAAS